jgi:hypothetical protein
MSAERELAVAEVLGVLAYGQLRSFAAMSSAVRHAPDARSADRVATFARREHDAYEALRGRLGELTDLPEAAMDRQKVLFDAFFDQAPLGDWFGASVFFAFGIPLARDFARTLVPLLDTRSAEVLVRTLDDRGEAEAAALALLRTQLGDEGARRRARGLVADLLGRALTAFQQGSASTDALRVLFDAPGAAGDRARELAMDLLARHRGRLVELGLEDVEGLADAGDPTVGAPGS